MWAPKTMGLNLTRQEKQVLLFVGAVVLAGIAIQYFQKINPRFKVVLPPVVAAQRAATTIIDKKVNPNKANSEELIRLPGIGPALAENIIEYRNSHGGFKSLEELEKVKGLGPKKLERLKDYLEVDKSPY